MNYKIDNSINNKTFIQEYMDRKESLLNELGKYFSAKYNTGIIPIAIKKPSYGNKMRAHFFYFYKDNTIFDEELFLNYSQDINKIFIKYGFYNIERYISNSIFPNRKTIVYKDPHYRLDAYVYAMTDDSILMSDGCSIILDNTDEIEIDYTTDNLNIIDEL